MCTVLSGECFLTFLRNSVPSPSGSSSPKQGITIIQTQHHIPKDPQVYQHCCKSLKLCTNQSTLFCACKRTFTNEQYICINSWLGQIPTDQHTPISINLLSNPSSLYKGFKVHIYNFFLNNVTTYI